MVMDAEYKGGHKSKEKKNEHMIKAVGACLVVWDGDLEAPCHTM
jgi:hypothetical protein